MKFIVLNKQKKTKMPKLYFRYGCMSSSKTANLLMTAWNYEQQGATIWVIKPSIDDRNGSQNIIKSRTGLERKADLVIRPHPETLPLELLIPKHCECVLVDEAQFLAPERINELRLLSTLCNVICYGLRTDYSTTLFPGSKRLMEIADSIEEIKTICIWCKKKAIVNLKYRNNIIIKNGDAQIDIGMEDKYKAACWDCWNKSYKLK